MKEICSECKCNTCIHNNYFDDYFEMGGCALYHGDTCAACGNKPREECSSYEKV